MRYSKHYKFRLESIQRFLSPKNCEPLNFATHWKKLPRDNSEKYPQRKHLEIEFAFLQGSLEHSSISLEHKPQFTTKLVIFLIKFFSKQLSNLVKRFARKFYRNFGNISKITTRNTFEDFGSIPSRIFAGFDRKFKKNTF